MGVVEMVRALKQSVLIGLLGVTSQWAFAEELSNASSFSAQASVTSANTSVGAKSADESSASNLENEVLRLEEAQSLNAAPVSQSSISSSESELASSSSSQAVAPLDSAAQSTSSLSATESEGTVVASLSGAVSSAGENSAGLESAASSVSESQTSELAASMQSSSPESQTVSSVTDTAEKEGRSLLDSEVAAESSAAGLDMVEDDNFNASTPEPIALPTGEIEILGQKIPPSSYRRLTWSSDSLSAGFSEPTPVLVVNGANPGPTLCLVGAIHGDELNGVEMIRSVIFDLDPAKLNGVVIGVPVANIMGFRRNSRYLPDRRDWNRYFPGNTHGSTASRLAHSFFNNVITHCTSLVDLHTGSFHRTNLPQLRADLSDEQVARLAQSFGDIAVLNSRGNPSSLRAAAIRAGIPAVTMEAGEPQHIQREVVVAGVTAIKSLLAKTEMYGRAPKWGRVAPVYYRSSWVRANQNGILFSRVHLGKRVREGEILGSVTDPITNARTHIISPFNGRILGMALDQVVLPGFAAYHIGVQTAEQILIEEGQMAEGPTEIDEEDGDDAGVIVPEQKSSVDNSVTEPDTVDEFTTE